MAFDFPSSGLTVGEIITGPNNTQYKWDGTKWTSVTTLSGSFLPITGGTLSAPGSLGVTTLAVTGTTTLDGTTATTPAPGDNTTNVATTAFVHAAVPLSAFNVPVAFSVPGKPAAAGMVNIAVTMALTIPSGLAGATVFDNALATANAVFTVNKISGGVTTALGTVTITPTSHTSATLAGAGGSVVAGDTLQLAFPGTQDATLADVAITIATTRT